MENLDLRTILPMLQQLGISPENLGPEKMNKLLQLSSKIGDPSTMTPESAADIIRTLGISLQGNAKPKTTEKIPRNSKCPCKSGRKWKKCCGAIHRSSNSEVSPK